MKRKLGIWSGGVLVAGLLTAMAGAQSLGEYARQQRAQKPATPANAKVYTNDNLPAGGGVSQVSAGSAASSSASSSAASKPEEKEDRSKLEAEWRAKFKAQKDKIALLAQDLEVSEREYQNRRGMIYNDPSKVVAWQQHPETFGQDELKHEKETKDKEKEVADEKQKLEDMKDELRRAGLPGSWSD